MGIKTKLTSVFALSALATAVFAGGPDVPAAPVCNAFDGLYAGVAGGWAWVSPRANLNVFLPNRVLFQRTNYNRSQSSFAIGGVLGYGTVMDNNFYIGVEGHGTYHDLGFTRSAPFRILGANATVSTRVSMDWDWGVDLMPGYVWNSNVLLFGKIGYRGADFNLRTSSANGFDVNNVARNFNFSRDRYLNGFNLGLGVKYSFNTNWSAWIEYDYTWFSTANNTAIFGLPLFQVNHTFENNAKARYQQVLVGVSYNFCNLFNM